jgi:hypothetical protein
MSANKANAVSLKDIPETTWIKLSSKKIFFGHQSVGSNIIDGMNKMMVENPQIKLQIVQTKEPAEFNKPLFGHSPVGENVDPKSKTDDFAEFMNAGLGNKADIAFFKFCFVDFEDGTDVVAAFDHYRKIMASLKAKYPKTEFVHVTVPLTSVKLSGTVWIKNLVKKVIGRPSRDHYADNVTRNAFNEMLRKEYVGKEQLFDLAAVESTLPSGERTGFKQKEVCIYTLAPDYTYDGGHLNDKGRKVAAEQFLLFLANLVTKEKGN